MALTAGTRLGPYEIVSAIGAGGMGEVYRARDTRLDREVAIKVLPESVAADPDRRARFEREAKAVAALSHPNILAIHDVGTDQSVFYAVTELLHGETLRERLTHGSLAPRKAIEIAIQIARALAAAHDRGLVHRDLKPENVFLLKDGHVKLLDFGLAKAVSRQPDGAAATRTVELGTEPGAVMGTVGYMSPEQVRGQDVDARTDIFALGAVLYEMLAGRRAFKRDTAAETMTAILRDEPQELTADRPDVSPALDRIVRHCLEKSPGERFQSARDVAFALEALSGSSVSSSATAAINVPPTFVSRRRPWPLVAAALVVGLGLGALAGARLLERPEVPLKFETKTWDAEWISNARFAPDGQTIVFSAARVGNAPRLYVIRPGSVVSQQLGKPNTELLAMSKTGELAVLTDANSINHRVFIGTLGRMTLDGAERPVLEQVTEADWAPDGQNLAVVHVVGGRSQLEYPIGQKLVGADAGYLSDPRVSPDGARVAYFEHVIPRDDRGWVKVVDRSGRVTTLAGEYGGLEGLAWSPDGKSVMFSVTDGGDYQPLVVDAAAGATAHPAFASIGSITVFDQSSTGAVLAMRTDQRHSIRGLPPGDTSEHEYAWLDFAIGGFFTRDGRTLAFSDLSQTAGADYAVAIRGTDDSPVVRLGPGGTLGPSPDGRWVAAVIPSKQQWVLYPTGPGSVVTLERGPVRTFRYVGQWFEDGRRLLECGNDASGVSRCYQQPIAGGPPTPVTPDGTFGALVAPDDRTMLTRTETGAFFLGSVGSSDRRPVSGLTPADVPLSFSRDLKSVFCQVGASVPSRVDRVDLTTGARTLAKELAPPDRSAVTLVQVDQWLDDGRAYTYRYARTLSTLFVARR